MSTSESTETKIEHKKEEIREEFTSPRHLSMTEKERILKERRMKKRLERKQQQNIVEE